MSHVASALMAGRYRLDEQIAVGGFGDVWRGTDIVLDRQVAVKVPRAGWLSDQVALARFRAEARHTAVLSHPNIASVYDFCEPGLPGSPFLVMEFVAGPSLAALLATGPMTVSRAMAVVADAAAGLAAAHRAGVVHRDIKPGNLLLTTDGAVKITDFGIAHAAGAVPLTCTGAILGTPAYLAPERVRGAGGTAASDLYSLGVVAYHCLTGSVPFEGIPVEVAVAHRDRPMPPLPPGIPREVAALIAQLTAKDPAARPATAQEVARRASQLRDRAFPADKTRRELPALRSRRRVGTAVRRTAVASALALASIGIVLDVLLPGQGADSGGRLAAAARASAPRASAPRMAAEQIVQVNAASLTGQQVSVVVSQLRALGLPVRVIWQASGTWPAGTVLSVRPAGELAAGTWVYLVAAAPAAQQRLAAGPSGPSGPPPRQEADDPGPGHGHGDGPGHGDGHGHGPK